MTLPLRCVVASFFGLLLLLAAASAASAQTCPAPYSAQTSPQTGGICATSCAPGSYPYFSAGHLSCVPGTAPPTCPTAGDFVILTATGATCAGGAVPAADATGVRHCNAGEVEVQRPPYLVDGQQLTDVCAPGPSCPTGYIETVDPDGYLGAQKVCMLPCQDFVISQGMACSCGAGGRLDVLPSGGPIQQMCVPICQPGSKWVASSPLFAFKPQEGTCVSPVVKATPCPAGAYWNGQQCVASAIPSCPPNTYWNGQLCLPAGIEVIGVPIPIKCPPNTHWNGSHCVPNTVPPICPAGQKWDGSKCVSICGPLQKWDGAKCVPMVQPICPAGQKWDGSKCVSICGPLQKWDGAKCVPMVQPICPAGQKWDGSKCVSICGPLQKWDGTKCVPMVQPICPPGQKWNGSKCVSICGPLQKWDGTKCVPMVQPICPPGKKWNNQTKKCE